MVAVTCTAEDEAEVIMWRDGHDSDAACDGATAMMVGEPAMHQTVEVRGAITPRSPTGLRADPSLLASDKERLYPSLLCRGSCAGHVLLAVFHG